MIVLAMPLSLAQFGSIKKAFDKGLKLSEMSISEEDERKLGEAISERIRQAYGVQQDEEATRYVTLVGKVVAAKSSRPDLDYQFIILDSDSTNAFAAPGGLIHITRGALAVMESEAELAGVLAHEIAHVTEKHTIKGLQKMKGIEFASDETSITANSEIFDKLAEKGTEALLSGFGRKEELSADEVGVHLAVACNYSQAGLVHFLEGLQARYSSREQRAGLFASHPETEERLKKLHSEIGKAKLDRPDSVMLTERFESQIRYELASFSGTGTAVEGARGMAGDSKQEEGTKGEDTNEKEKSGGLLGKIKNPFGSGEKKQRAEVTGTAAARGVETELGTEEPGNPARVVVIISAEELDKFKREGKLA
jgi:predicted Zn-dependent protease